jgi:hypothetical protein
MGLETPEREAAYQGFILAKLRVARARIKLLINEIDTIGIALKSGAITPDEALVALYQAGSMNFLREDLDGEIVTNGVGADRASPPDQRIGNDGAADAGADAG